MFAVQKRWLVALAAMALAVLLAPPAAAHAAGAPLAAADAAGAPLAAHAAGGGDIPVPSDSLADRGVGTVTAADRDFVIRVRLAGLWEIPASNMAVQKSDDPRIVQIGKTIAAQHVILDQLDRDAAKKLGISLPDQPNSDQQYWLSEMRVANSTTFDQIYVDRLRAAHGKIFPAIATIRASTRNDIVRKLAQEANQFVMTHMTLLESSGIVDYGALPTAPAPATTGQGPVPVDGQLVAAASANSGVPGVNTTIVLAVLAVALVAGVITSMRIFRSR